MTAQKGTLKLMEDVSTSSQELSVQYGNYTVDLNGHTWTSTASVGITIGGASKNIYLTIEDTAVGGKMVNTDSSATLLKMTSGNLTLTGGSFESGSTVVSATGGSLTVSGGSFAGAMDLTGIAAADIGNIQLSGGTFSGSITTAASVPVGALLKSGYAYKTTSDSKWVSDVSASSISAVSVAAAPVTITTQPVSPAAADYGYAAGPELSVTATATNSQNTITYQWYQGGAVISGATAASYTVPTGLDAGSHVYTCKVTCDDYALTSSAATFLVNGITGSVSNKDYAVSYTYTGSAVAAPAGTNFTANSDGALTFTWYSGETADESGKLSGAPTNAGTYTLKVDLAATASVTAASITLKVTVAKADPQIGDVTYTGGTLYTSADPAGISLTRASTTIPGALTLDGVTALTTGKHSYKWKFVPTDAANYQTVSGTIDLTAGEDTLQSISAAGTPTKTGYAYGDSFETAGLTVTAAYASGAKRTVTGLVTSSALETGGTSVTLSYAEGSITKTCTVTGITVSKKTVAPAGLTAPANRAYNGKAVTVSEFGTPAAGAYSGSYTYAYYQGETLLNAAPVDAGSYTLRVSIPSDAENYTGQTEIPFTIQSAVVTASADNQSMGSPGS